MYNFPILNLTDHPVGFIGIDFVSKPQELSEEQERQIISAAKRISGHIVN